MQKQPTRSTTRSQLAIAVGALGLFLVAAFALMPTFLVGTYQDDALYINLAHAIAGGHGYVDLMYVGNPPHTFVPPVYPVLLTPLLGLLNYEWLLANNFWPLQALSAILAFGGLCLFGLMLKQFNVWGWGFVVALASLAPTTLGMGWHVMSEAPYFFFVCAALLCMTMWTRDRRHRAWMVASIASACLASITRLIGIALLGAVALYLWRNLRMSRKLAGTAVLFLPVSMWFLRNALLGTSIAGEYASGLSPQSIYGFARSVCTNLLSIALNLIPGTLVPGLTGPATLALLSRWGLAFLPTVIGVAVFAVLVIGLVRTSAAHAGLWFTQLYLVFYGGILVMTQFAIQGGQRYLAPITPLLVYYVWQGTAWVIHRGSRLVSRVRPERLMQLGAVLLLTLYLGRATQARLKPVRDRLPNIALGTTWLRVNTPSDAVVMAEEPRNVFLFAQRKVVAFPNTVSDQASLAHQIACSRATYLLVRPALALGMPPRWSSVTEQVIPPVLEATPHLLREVYSSSDEMALVYRIDKEILACTMDPSSHMVSP